MKIYNETNPKIFNALQPQILGVSYNYELKKGKKLALYYTLADKNILNYEIYSLNGILETFYYECNSFPFCEINEKTIKTAKKIKNFNSFSNLALNNKKLQNTSAISKKQYLIILSCKNEKRKRN